MTHPHKIISNTIYLSMLVLSLVTCSTYAAIWAEENDDIHLQLLRESSYYKNIVAEIEKKHSLIFKSQSNIALGNVIDENGDLIIEINPDLTGARRTTIIIWEIVNSFQREIFDDIGKRVMAGEINNAREYGLRMEMVEYTSFRHHKRVLLDLQLSIGGVDADYLFFINPALKRLEDYSLPYVHDYIDAQAKSGHTAHYERWYDKIKAQSK